MIEALPAASLSRAFLNANTLTLLPNPVERSQSQPYLKEREGYRNVLLW